MHDSLLVRHGEPLGYLRGIVNDSTNGQRAIAQPLAQSLAFQ